MIAIVDYGMGNLGSIRNMLLRIGTESIVTSNPVALAAAERLILPGVGHFDRAVENLERLGLVEVLQDVVLNRGRLVLGICLGMQLLSRGSEEGIRPGLGWIAADTVRFRFEGEHARLKVPHMGWSAIEPSRESALLGDLGPDPRFYFVHSYHVRCDREEDVLAIASYGVPFHAAIGRDNILGTQFHPEKSHRFGLRVLRNFVEMPG
jgi:imidazole glycerol-phosphate synthase subunit HisH